ncbi:TPA: Mor transcription activator family protein [Pseudomonas aeruginosa]
MSPIFERLQTLIDQELQNAITHNCQPDYRQVLLTELGRLPRTDSFWVALLHQMLFLDPGLSPQQRATDFLNSVRAMPTYIPDSEEQARERMQQRIAEAFNGSNAHELASHFGVSVQFIYSSVKRAGRDDHLLDRLAELGGTALAERIRAEFGGTSSYIPS